MTPWDMGKAAADALQAQLGEDYFVEVFGANDRGYAVDVSLRVKRRTPQVLTETVPAGNCPQF